MDSRLSQERNNGLLEDPLCHAHEKVDYFSLNWSDTIRAYRAEQEIFQKKISSPCCESADKHFGIAAQYSTFRVAIEPLSFHRFKLGIGNVVRLLAAFASEPEISLVPCLG